ncbi:MAG: adenylyltransferase/cytidyltransferase family protein [Candidatus Wildermuthbacteria bacterium]|nr:adenylyltransferase/cytidyltransferase family protein [Candidatus Wildermuthbacteria bacterium]
MEKKKKAVVFGVFDGVHDGHRFLFSQAQRHGEELIVIVSRDSSAERLKRRKPKYSEKERMNFVAAENGVGRVFLGDETLSTYGVLEKICPDVVCFGYDQETLEQDFLLWMLKNGEHYDCVRLESFMPDAYHTSLLKSL